ncbi:hypothetical protein YC2023_033435 [Brassica napus]
MDSRRIDVLKKPDCFVTIETCIARSLRSDQDKFGARSLHSDRTVRVLGLYVATEQVFDTMPRDVRDQCAGFRARPRSNHGSRRCDDYRLTFPVSFST